MQETVYRVPGCPLSLALLTDTHNTVPGEILESLRRNRPEIICIAGDFCFAPRPGGTIPVVWRQRRVLPLLTACAELAPTFLSLGNHEWLLSRRDLRLIGAAGVTVLDNSWAEHRGIFIGGLTPGVVDAYRRYRAGIPLREQYPRWPLSRQHVPMMPRLQWLGEFECLPGYRILLCHQPEYYLQYLSRRDLDLVLSGHAHGGQIRLLGRGLYAPGQGLFPKYTGGIHEKLIISRGLANTGAPIPRLFNDTELVYLR